MDQMRRKPSDPCSLFRSAEEGLCAAHSGLFVLRIILHVLRPSGCISLFIHWQCHSLDRFPFD